MALLLLESYRGIVTADSDDRYSYVSAAAKDSTIASATPRWATGSYVSNGVQAGQMLRKFADITWPLFIEFGLKRTAGQIAQVGLIAFYGWQGPNAGSATGASFGYLVINPDGTISIHRKFGAGSFPCLATSVKSMKNDGWHFIQIKWTVLARYDGGEVLAEVYVDGQLWLTYDGAVANNPNVGSPVFDINPWTYIEFIGPNDASASATGYPVITDVVICDSTGTDHIAFQGPVDIETIRPDGAGNYAQFTPSAGSNFQNVDETTPDGDTTYNASSTVDHRDSYSFSALARASGVIKGLCVNVIARTPEASIHQANVFLRESGGDIDDADLIIGQDFKHVRSTNFAESMSGPWTIAKINAIELGLRRR